MLNLYENQKINISTLPKEWQNRKSLDGLLSFLQFNWEQRSIFYDDGEVQSNQQFFVPVKLDEFSTKGYIGTVVYNGGQLNIFPKAFRGPNGSGNPSELNLKHLMHNIVNWLAYTSKVDYPYINISAEYENTENLLELFITLYVRYVEAALRGELYYRYEEQSEDLQTVRGRLNITDYVTKKYPNGILDKFRCEYSTYEFDNLLNRIIKCTLSRLYANKYTSSKNQRLIRSLLLKLEDVSTVNCTPRDCDKVKLTKSHNRYKIVLSLSKMFLMNKSTGYSLSSQDSFCFLFPTHLLFEGFVCGFLQSVLGNDARVTPQASDMYLVDDICLGDKHFGHAFLMRHDILVRHKEKGDFILDTKYKMLNRFNGNGSFAKDIASKMSSGDLYQVLAYAVSRGINKVFLLYPQYRKEDIEPDPAVLVKPVKIAGISSNVYIYAVRLPFVFEEGDNKTKENLEKVLLSLFF